MVVGGGRANASKRGKKMTRVEGNEEALVHLVPLLALHLDPLAPPLCTRRRAGLEEPNANQRKKTKQVGINAEGKEEAKCWCIWYPAKG